MVSSELHVDISRPKRDVWAFMTKVENVTLWWSGILKVATTNGMLEGSQLSLTTLNMGREFDFTAVITDNDGGSTLAAESQQGPITFETRYTLEDIEGGTRVHFSNHINTHAVFHLAEGVLQEVSDARYKADLVRLKHVLESAKVSKLS